MTEQVPATQAIKAALEHTPRAAPDSDMIDNISDWSMATQYLDSLQERKGTRPVYTLGSWWDYNKKTGVWDPVPDMVIHYEIVKEYHGGRYITEGKDGPEEKTLWLSYKKSSAIYKAVRVLGTEDEFFGSDIRVGFRDGALMQDDRRLRWAAKSPENKLRFAYGFDYVDTRAAAPKFQSFLSDILPNPKHRQILQQYLGACMLNAGTKIQRGIFLYGEAGNNGKSTFVDILRKAYPDGAVASLSPASLGKDLFRLVHLDGAVINLLDENPDKIGSSDQWKSIITGGAISARRPHGQPYYFTPTAGHVYCCNALPETRDHTGGFWRRPIPIPFKQEIPKEKINKTLRDEIVNEELPGVVGWLVEGAREALALEWDIDFDDSEIAATLAQWRAETDSVRAWLSECEYEPDAKQKTWRKLKDVYKGYAQYCKDGNHGIIAYGRFRPRLRQAGVICGRPSGRGWCVPIYEKSSFDDSGSELF